MLKILAIGSFFLFASTTFADFDPAAEDAFGLSEVEVASSMNREICDNYCSMKENQCLRRARKRSDRAMCGAYAGICYSKCASENP